MGLFLALFKPTGGIKKSSSLANRIRAIVFNEPISDSNFGDIYTGGSYKHHFLTTIFGAYRQINDPL